MSASLAVTGYGARFYLGTAASPFSYNISTEIRSINKQDYTIPPVEVTHLLSDNSTEEMIPGLIKPGTLDITGNFIGDAAQLSITPLAAALATCFWKITCPVQSSAKTYTATGRGFIVKYQVGPFEKNKAIDFALTLQITGAVTETVA